ncbi:hypothetical protein DFR41_104215 [Pseudacidovorax intermedius]|uniref:Uncharacterized protein n=1 Tax=Pseudacidovorax intermedius TaxID=433924 RepID=A0A370FJ56_9BURK|nr:hypothetical protein [Pseudacidovorax intermedius]RDI25159.1 hypothetical protein DFR41_104215 [Pseudacidovorax intermedius]
MAKDWSSQLNQVNFQCRLCRHAWEGPPDLIEDDPEAEHHPYRYFADCPRCDSPKQPQAGWARALLKAHQAATGPVTPKGKAATAANLAGHPTPEETLRTRFNAMKHGMAARTATYFPAKPDRYAFCEGCEVNRLWCSEQPACVKQTEIFMLHHAAFEQRNPKVLGKLHADLQASLTASLQMLLQSVLGDGVVIKTPRVELSREGVPVALTYTDAAGEVHHIYDYRANPAFKPIADLVTRLGLSMGDLGLTVRAGESEEDRMAGTLKLDQASKETLVEFNQRMAVGVEAMRERLGRAGQRMRADPVLIEHQAQQQAEDRRTGGKAE